MSKKYVPDTPHSTLRLDSARVITNDLYLAAFLHSTGCQLYRLRRNDRRRVSFEYKGSKVRELRNAYRAGPVRLDMRSFRDSLLTIRRLMDNEQRSFPCHTAPSPMQLSQV